MIFRRLTRSTSQPSGKPRIEKRIANEDPWIKLIFVSEMSKECRIGPTKKFGIWRSMVDRKKSTMSTPRTYEV